jgi:hydrogenase maturation protease
MTAPNVLVAGIGNIFFGDDGFGVEVVRRLAGRDPGPGIRVTDFGIRGFDLTCALLEPHDRVILVDASSRGGVPGTLYVLEIQYDQEAPASVEAHGMAPEQVLRAVRSMGGTLNQVYLVGCEPQDFGDPESGRMGLSAPVEAAVETAIEMIESLAKRGYSHA